VARGNVAVSDGFAACREDVRVRIQRKVGGDWHPIASTFTDSAGVFREPIPDRVGTYRAVAPKVVRRTTSADGRSHQSWSTDGEDPFQVHGANARRRGRYVVEVGDSPTDRALYA
jgi:hypothetical protein